MRNSWQKPLKPHIYGHSRRIYLILVCFHLLEESCDVQLYIKRQSVHSVSAGDPFKLECPVKYCDDRPNVTWCKLKGSDCLDYGDGFQPHTSWKEDKNISVFILHFEPVSPSDNGSYRCFVNLSSKLITSHSTIIHVTGEFSTPRLSNVFLIMLPGRRGSRLK